MSIKQIRDGVGMTAIIVALACVAATGCSSKPRATRVKADPALATLRSTTFDRLALDQLREQAVGVLVAMADHDDPQVRANAIEGLTKVPARAAEVIAKATKDESAAVRAVAAMGAGRERLRETMPSIRTLLNDPSEYVRAAAIFAMVRCDETVDRSPLGGMLVSDDSLKLRAHAAYILGEIGDRSAQGMLRDAMGKVPARASEAEVRLFQMQVAEALIKLGDDSELAGIRAALFPAAPEDLEMTALSMQILGQVKDTSSVSGIITLIERRTDNAYDMPPEIRLLGASTLAKLGNVEGDFIGDQYRSDDRPMVRMQVASVYGETRHRENLGVLAEMLRDPDERVLVAAATGILNIVR
ncbi:MAG: HEAT repeat domain-containing protein [Phycisphaerales bacterium]|nr:MAG: HEAT repeat domain-containing protein [Phycisphaerales bacterium]